MQNNELFEDLSKLVKLIDELRDEGLQDHIKLPRIAVIGTQSSGKSSLIEAIVGLDFLPRGDGVVTRRPLELRLKHIPEDTDGSAWAVFGDKNETIEKSEKIFDFDKVRMKINEFTDRDAGKGKNIIDKPIVLNVFSHTCPDLTIIDLPGITRIPCSDQPKNIEEITKEMAYRYINDARTIILCVISGNMDISVSDGLQMAKNVDPDGYRTIGVITKIDILDHGTDAISKLQGKDIHLRLGFIGCVGRSQKDINDKISVQKGLANEEKFFKNTPPYSTLSNSENMLGTKSLKKKLTEEMYKHIADCLPLIDKEIEAKLSELETKLNGYADSPPVEEDEKLKYLWKLLSDFLDSFKNSIKGKFEENSNVEFSFGTKIKCEFKNLFSTFHNYKASENITDQEIREKIDVYQGFTLPGFPRIDLFLDILYPELIKLTEPSFKCLDNVFNLLFDLAKDIIIKMTLSFPAFSNEFIDFVHFELDRERHEAKKIIKQIMEAQKGYLYTCNEKYRELTDSVENLKETKKKSKGNDAVFIEHLKQKIDIYFEVILQTLRDSIPKAIGFFLIKESQEKLKFSLFNDFLKNKEVLGLLAEPKEIVQDKKSLRRTIKVLVNCQTILKKDADVAIIRKYMNLIPPQSESKPMNKTIYMRQPEPTPVKQEFTPIIQRDKNPSQNSLFAKVEDKKPVTPQQDLLGKRQIFAEPQKPLIQETKSNNVLSDLNKPDEKRLFGVFGAEAKNDNKYISKKPEESKSNNNLFGNAASQSKDPIASKALTFSKPAELPKEIPKAIPPKNPEPSKNPPSKTDNSLFGFFGKKK